MLDKYLQRPNMVVGVFYAFRLEHEMRKAQPDKLANTFVHQAQLLRIASGEYADRPDL